MPWPGRARFAPTPVPWRAPKSTSASGPQRAKTHWSVESRSWPQFMLQLGTAVVLAVAVRHCVYGPLNATYPVAGQHAFTS